MRLLCCCCLRRAAPPKDGPQKATKKAAKKKSKTEEIEVPRLNDECDEACHDRKDERRAASVESDSELSLERSDFRSNYREPLVQRVLDVVNESRSSRNLCHLQLDGHLQAVAEREWLTARQWNKLSGLKGSGGCAYVYFPGNHITCDCPAKKHGALAFRSLRGFDFRSEELSSMLVTDLLRYWMDDAKHLLNRAVESPEQKEYLECRSCFPQTLFDSLDSAGKCGIHIDMIEESAGEAVTGGTQANSICVVLLLGSD